MMTEAVTTTSSTGSAVATAAETKTPTPTPTPTSTVDEIDVGSVTLPPWAAPLTAGPCEATDTAQWITLSESPTTAPSASFWYAMDALTHQAHWNRTLYALHPKQRCYTRPRPPDVSHEAHLVDGACYTALRHFRRKTPAPVGPSVPCYDAVEWARHVVLGRLHCAVFALVIPSCVVTADNPRAMTYWPFQYPKARAYRFVYCPGVEGAQSSIRYDVLPLYEHHPHEYEDLLKHSRPGAEKLITMLRKRLDKFDPQLGVSTYEKRVYHDRLITEAEYRTRYDSMKRKYSFWAQQWTECTDPQKFVFEEMAIAAYLCALWKREREEENLSRLQTFVDMGCGNGFLVYLLISEGHPGIGVDIRRRDIWNKYPEHVTAALHEQTVDPVSYDVSPYDWVLGNHSDELSPWIPVMTARSQRRAEERRICQPVDTLAQSPTADLRRAYPRFFVLPCCFYDFDGRKVSFGRTRRTLGVRAVAGMGKYEQYYRWIAQIGRAFGFTTEFENLRIPSTKYVSVLGRFVEFEERVDPKVTREMIGLLMLDARQSRM